MSKAFVKEVESDGEEEGAESPLPVGVRNYLSPSGYARLEAELRRLVETERPGVVKIVSWAASNGDRSENGDYIYGKRRLREIDRRVRFLIKRLESAEVVETTGRATDQVFFGATVTYATASGEEQTVRIVGIDEMDPAKHYVSWVSPVARALIKAREGDSVRLRTPVGEEDLEILEVRYEAIPVPPFEPVQSGWTPNAR